VKHLQRLIERRLSIHRLLALLDKGTNPLGNMRVDSILMFLFNFRRSCEQTTLLTELEEMPTMKISLD